MLPPIKGFIQNTLIDWEGKIAAEIFLPDCNFRCQYCHASHLVLKPSQLESIPFQDILDFLVKGIGWLDGIVISGGEPTLSGGLEELLRSLRRHGMQTKLDTNGSRPEVLQDLLQKGLLDCVAMDIKAPLNGRYSDVVGVPVNLDAIRESVRLLLKGDCDYEFRTTVCPGLLDKDDVVQIAREIKGARRYVLQSFRPLQCINPDLIQLEPYSLEAMLEMAEAARPWVGQCFVRGHQEVGQTR